MSAIVTDQFRILNANNFVDSVVDSNNSYYVFVGLPNPSSTGFGREDNWDPELEGNMDIPDPIDNIQYLSHYRDTSIFGKKIASSNIRRIIRRIDWTINTKYEMYRHDYSILNQTPISNSSRLYSSNYYVMNSDYRVYICIYNGSSGVNPKGNSSKDEPTFTDLEPSSAGESGDGYLWKYLFTVAPSDIIKFDSTEYIAVPNDWGTGDTASVKENGNSTLEENNNQIKKVYIQNGGRGYSSGECDILGDGSGGRVLVEVDSIGSIISTTVIQGGSGYTWGIVDLGGRQPEGGSLPYPAKLIPIIPPSKGHGYDIYTELGTDKVLIYTRFDDSTKDFPTDTKFSQIGILRNPSSYTSTQIFTENQYSSLYSIKLTSDFTGVPSVGSEMTQITSGTITAKGYVASYDTTTKVLKYFRDRSLYFGAQGSDDETDYSTVTDNGGVIEFQSSTNQIQPFAGSIDRTFNDDKVTVGSKVVNLGVRFTNGLANPEINKESGDVIYIDNRPLVSRNSRQKEDIKIILEF
jgi:hypothetical protein